MYDTTDQRPAWVGCNGCGNCCENIPINFTMRKLKEMSEQPINQDNEDLQENARQLPVLWYKRKGYYQCRAFDRKTRSCMVQDTKPPICRDYPFYNQHSPKGVNKSFDCSFSKLLPILSVNGKTKVDNKTVV